MRGIARAVPGGVPHVAVVLLSWVLLLQGAPPALAQNQPDFFGLGDLSGGAADSAAHAVSADGLVVVGESESGSGVEAFRWTDAGGMVGLGTLSGGDFFSTANGVSSDGSVVAGTASNSDGGTAFRWTSGGGMVGLDQLGCLAVFVPCPDPAIGAGISPDGQTVVGTG
ncbi:MAG: PEP-CTERM sorting domain-containing protein, partial [Myxococcales bacterium]|nr:PEP-CTERM sorting domain-containing protein [Myxococcales bacterium]